MNNLLKKLHGRLLRRGRVRSKVIGTNQRPRLNVFISNRHIHAQIINDQQASTVASSTSAIATAPKGNIIEKAAWVGEDIAKKAKITKVVLDRNGRKYHGRLKSLADAARQGGLEF